MTDWAADDSYAHEIKELAKEWLQTHEYDVGRDLQIWRKSSNFSNLKSLTRDPARRYRDTCQYWAASIKRDGRHTGNRTVAEAASSLKLNILKSSRWWAIPNIRKPLFVIWALAKLAGHFLDSSQIWNEDDEIHWIHPIPCIVEISVVQELTCFV